MARIVCQVLHRADRITLIWSEGLATFEPYHIEGAERAQVFQLAGQIHEQLADGTAPTRLGYQLLRALFRLDAAEPGAAPGVYAWLSDLMSSGKIDSIEFLSDISGLIPWNVIIDDPDADVSRFWGARFQLGAGRRVNILRQNPVQIAPTQLAAVDGDLADSLHESQRPLLGALRTSGLFVQSEGALADELKKQAPDVLLLLTRFDKGQLKLGDGALGVADLQAWLEEPREGNPDPLIILMGCGDRSEATAWQVFLSDASAAFSGLVAAESLLPTPRAFAVGQAIAQRFVEGTQSVGQILQTLRQELGVDALAFSAFCPPELRVMKDGEPPALTATTTSLPLPALPYRPFAAYDASERSLFFGRENDTLRGALLTDQATTGGLLLHGAPASGKTSYLQAGLLPFLEQESIGYRVLRDRTPATATPTPELGYPALILRATNDLAGQLAEALSAFCAQPYVYTTPAGGQVTVDLPRILKQTVTGNVASSGTSAPSTSIQPAETAGAMTTTPTGSVGHEVEALAPDEIWIALRDNPKLLATVVDAITCALPFELIIAVDQGEDLLTLVRTPQQRERRAKALKMFDELAESAARCKLIFVLRSQSLGQFVSLFPEEKAPAHWRAFYLPPLPESVMVDALMWPTNREEVPYATQIPSQKYGFTYEAGMAQQIVAEAIDAGAADLQSPLALIQAVGALLYEKHVVAKNQNVVRMADLKEQGGVRTAMMKCLENSIEKLKFSRSSQRGLRQLIAKLYTSNADGTVGRDLVPANELKSHWTAKSEPVEPIVNKATDEAGLFDIQQLMIGGQSDIYVSLPQDSLAQLGRKIDGERELYAFGRTRVIDTLWIMIPFAFLCAVLAWFGTRSYLAAGLEELVTKTANDFAAKKAKETYATELRRPIYNGLIARADQALRADNALRARQILREEPASRNIHEDNEGFPDLRGFEWRYLWKSLHSERFHLQGHRGAISAVAVSKDGKRAASAGPRGDQKDDDAVIRVWNLETGEELARIPGPNSPALCVAFAPDGKTIAAGFADKSIRLWDISSLKTDFVRLEKEAKSLAGHEDAVHAIVFMDDQTLISGSADKAVIFWDIAAGKEKQTLKEHTAAVKSLALTSDGKTLASAGADGQLLLWDAQGMKKRQAITTPYRTIAALAVSPDDKTIAAGGADAKFGVDVGTIRFFNLSDGKEGRTAITHSNEVLSLAYRPDGETIASGGRDFIIRMWDLKSGNEERKWLGHYGAITALAFAKETNALVSGSIDAQVKVWNPDQSAGPDVIRAHDDWVQCLALNAKNTLLASGARDGSVKLWNPATGKRAAALPYHSGAITGVAFSAHKDKIVLAVSTRDDKNEGEIKIWHIDGDAKSGYKPIEKQTLKSPQKGVTCVAFNPTEERANVLASGGADGSVVLWDADSGKETKTHKAHTGEVRCIAFLADGSALASGGKDGNVRMFDLDHGDTWMLDDLHPGPIEAIAHGQRLGSDREDVVLGLFTASADHTAAFWAYVRGKPGKMQAQRIASYRFHGQAVSGVLFNTRDASVVTSSWDKTMKLVELSGGLSGNERYTFQGHTGAVRAIVLAANFSFLASAGNDGTIRIWRAEPPRAPSK